MEFQDLQTVECETLHAMAWAFAQLGREAALVARLATPSLCVGEQVAPEQVIDADFCRARSLPILRSPGHSRTLCLAQTQLELVLVQSRERPCLRQLSERACSSALTPLLDTCRALGLPAAILAPNEVVVRGRRIVAACLGERERMALVNASLALEFDADLFARALHCPDESWRGRLRELAHARRTSLHQELGRVPEWAALTASLRASLEHVVGPLQPAMLDEGLLRRAQRDRAEMAARRWAPQRNGTSNGWYVEVGAGTVLQRRNYHAPGGLIRATLEWHHGRIITARLAGDFLCYPPGGIQRLEAALVGVRADEAAARVGEFYHEFGWVTPGIQPSNWAKVLIPMPVAYSETQPA